MGILLKYCPQASPFPCELLSPLLATVDDARMVHPPGSVMNLKRANTDDGANTVPHYIHRIVQILRAKGFEYEWVNLCGRTGSESFCQSDS